MSTQQMFFLTSFSKILYSHHEKTITVYVIYKLLLQFAFVSLNVINFFLDSKTDKIHTITTI